jgi:hypothetical protein
MSPGNQGVFQLQKEVAFLKNFGILQLMERLAYKIFLFRKHIAWSFIFLTKSEDFTFKLTPYTDVHGITST